MTHSIRHCLSFFATILIVALFAADCTAKDKEEISIDKNIYISSFKEAIDINNEYKKLRNAKQYNAKYQMLRKERIHFLEDTFSELSLILKKYLSTTNDVELINLLLKYDLSLEGSADESVSFVLGEIFFNNPEPIIKAVSCFSVDDKNYLIKSIEWGLENYTYKKQFKKEMENKYKANLQILRGL